MKIDPIEVENLVVNNLRDLPGASPEFARELYRTLRAAWLTDMDRAMGRQANVVASYDEKATARLERVEARYGRLRRSCDDLLTWATASGVAAGAIFSFKEFLGVLDREVLADMQRGK